MIYERIPGGDCRQRNSVRQAGGRIIDGWIGPELEIVQILCTPDGRLWRGCTGYRDEMVEVRRAEGVPHLAGGEIPEEVLGVIERVIDVAEEARVIRRRWPKAGY